MIIQFNELLNLSLIVLTDAIDITRNINVIFIFRSIKYQFLIEHSKTHKSGFHLENLNDKCHNKQKH